MSSPQKLADESGTPSKSRGPQADAERAAHHARLARAKSLRGERRHRRDEPHAEHEGANSTICASAAAATTSPPRRPTSARSVVIIATWPSCVSAIGRASRTVSVSSARQSAQPAGAADGVIACGRVHEADFAVAQKEPVRLRRRPVDEVIGSLRFYVIRQLRKDDGMTQPKR